MSPLKRTACVVAACLLGATLALPAFARDGHGYGGHGYGGHYGSHIGLSIGIPIGWPYWGWYPYPYYYPPYPGTVVVPSDPPVYVEQPQAAPQEQGYWYYCTSAQAYYPYVKECPAGWQKVPARPAGE
jgi:hypothetical protein